MYDRHVAMSHRITDTVNRKNTIEDCRSRTDRDQAVHVWTSVPQCLKSVFKIFLICDQNWQQQ